MTADEFRQRFGFEPKNDDLERATCERAGELMHWFCGVCPACDRPRFVCGHLLMLDRDADGSPRDRP